MPLQHQEHETGHGRTPTAGRRDHKLLRLNREPFWLAVRHPPDGSFGDEHAFEGVRRAAESRRIKPFVARLADPICSKRKNTAWREHGDY
jgi:hypothetical protein